MREPSKAKTLKCAIYTRKSSEEGLEQDFNSLEAQREACEAYVKSQAHEGWTLIPDHFDDGGFSGGNMDRPALGRLLDKVRKGEVDIIVVYKIDRLTRSLMDFSKLSELLDEHEVSFVSITQQFNTTTSMGRLTLNMLLSFAQFEREVTGERIRDKFAASKRRGMWMGGQVPIGYDVKDRALVTNETEANTVRKIFELYLELGNVRLVADELNRLGLHTKTTVTKSGKTTGGLSFTRGHLYRLMSNPLYIGEISHKGVRHKGLHQPIIDRKVWDAVQDRLASNTQGESRKRKNAKQPSLLAGLLVDEFGNVLTSTHAVKDGKRYRYYASRRSAARGAHNRPVSAYRIPATEIEPLVIGEIVEFLRDAARPTAALDIESERPLVIAAAIAAAVDLAADLQSSGPLRLRELIEEMVERVILDDGRMRIELKRTELEQKLLGESGERPEPIVIDAAIEIGHRGVETRLVVESNAGNSSGAADDNLIRAIACGRAWFEELASGRAKSFREIADRVGVTDRYVSRLIDLAFLAPNVVEAVLEGRQRADVTVMSLTVEGRVAAIWAEQQREMTSLYSSGRSHSGL